MSKIDPKCSLIIQGQHNGPGNYTFHSTRWKVVQALASETRPKKMPFFLPMMLLNVLWPCLSCNYLWQFPLVCWSKSHHDSVLCFCMSFQSMFFLSSKDGMSGWSAFGHPQWQYCRLWKGRGPRTVCQSVSLLMKCHELSVLSQGNSHTKSSASIRIPSMLSSFMLKLLFCAIPTSCFSSSLNHNIIVSIGHIYIVYILVLSND